MKKIDFAVGGQALIEGVMIRSPNYISIAVRDPKGKIVTDRKPFVSLTKRYKIFGWPVIRGFINIIEMVTTGTKALNFSAEIAIVEEKDDKKEEKKKPNMEAATSTLSILFSVVISLAFAIFLFKFVPLFLTGQIEKIIPQIGTYYLTFNIVDGLIRITIFVLYIYLLSLFPSIRRVFEYHGAEHMAVFAYEHGKKLTPENVKLESPRHPRCGTSFIVIVLVVSIILFTLVPRDPEFWINFGYRLMVIPFIGGIGYEVLKWSAKYNNHFIVRFLAAPGIGTQYITTQQPKKDQIEVAITALQGALDLERID